MEGDDYRHREDILYWCLRRVLKPMWNLPQHVVAGYKYAHTRKQKHIIPLGNCLVQIIVLIGQQVISGWMHWLAAYASSKCLYHFLKSQQNTALSIGRNTHRKRLCLPLQKSAHTLAQTNGNTESPQKCLERSRLGCLFRGYLAAKL